MRARALGEVIDARFSMRVRKTERMLGAWPVRKEYANRIVAKRLRIPIATRMYNILGLYHIRAKCEVIHRLVFL